LEINDLFKLKKKVNPKKKNSIHQDEDEKLLEFVALQADKCEFIQLKDELGRDRNKVKKYHFKF
jgi:putative sterol carrier protein